MKSGLLQPVKRNFPINGLIFYAPLWHPEKKTSPITALDLVNYTTLSCTVTGTTWGIQGRTFDGVDDNIILPANWMPATGTIEMWVNKTPGGSDYLLSSDLNEISIYSDVVTNYIDFYYNGSSTGASATVFAGVFRHIVVTYGVNLNSIYYVDGALIAGGGACGAVTPTNVATRIGEGTGGAEDFAGTIGEVRIYNRVLSASEVSHNYQSTKWRYS